MAVFAVTSFTINSTRATFDLTGSFRFQYESSENTTMLEYARKIVSHRFV